MTREPRNEQQLCKAAMRLVADRRGEWIVRAQPVDVVVREKPAVEWVFDTPSVGFAVEHTRIESFASQITEAKLFSQLLGPLERELAGMLPGAFFLIVDVAAARVPAEQHAQVRRALSEWILANGATLDPEEQSDSDGNCDVTANPPGVPFEITLHRDSDYDSRLFIMQNVRVDLASLQRDRIRTALIRKCPKLWRAKMEGRVSILIMESDDVALANRRTIASATTAELSARDDAPDVVIWARTSTHPWKAWLLKDGPELHPSVSAPGPYVLNPAC